MVISREKGLKPTKVDEHTGDPPILSEMYKQEVEEALNTLQKSGTVIIRNVLCENSSRFQWQGFKVILQTVKQVPHISNSMFKHFHSCNFSHTDQVIDYHCSLALKLGFTIPEKVPLSYQIGCRGQNLYSMWVRSWLKRVTQSWDTKSREQFNYPQFSN